MTKQLSEMNEVERTEHICKLVADLTDIVRTETTKSAETREKLDKMSTELQATTRKVDTFQTILDTKLEQVTGADDANLQKIFDVTVKNDKLLAMWGYSNPVTKALYQPRTQYNYRAGRYEVSEKGYDGLEDLMLLNDALFIFGIAKAQRDGNLTKYPEYIRQTDTYKLFKAEIEAHKETRKGFKALNTATVGEGLEWVPTGMSAQMIDDLRLQLKVAAQFPQITMPLRTGSYDVPLSGSRRRAYLVGESISDSSEKIGTATPPSAKVTFTAIKHALRMLISYEMDEDAIIPMIPLMRAEIVQALADAEEDAVINGDNSTTHMDTGLSIAASDVRKSWKGLRYYGGNGTGSGGNACVDISTLSTANLRSIRKKMGRFGVDPRMLFWLTSISGYIQLLGLSEVITVDKYGQFATVVSGELGKFDGAPIIASEFVSQELNASGIYDGTTITKTGIYLVCKNAFWRASKGTMLSEAERDIEVQQQKVVMSRRLDFKRCWTPGSGEDVVGVGYNLAS